MPLEPDNIKLSVTPSGFFEPINPEPPAPPVGLIVGLGILVLFTYVFVVSLGVAALSKAHLFGTAGLLSVNLVGQALSVALTWRCLLLLQRAYGVTEENLGIARIGDLFLQIRYALRVYLISLPGLFLISLLVYFLVKNFGFPEERPEMQKLIQSAVQNPVTVLLFFLSASVGAPVNEELLFRGLLYSGFRLRWGVTASLLVSSIWFTFMHVKDSFFNDPRVFPLGIFALGLLLAWIRERTGSVIPGMVIHALNNSLALLMVLMVKQAI